jgi:hypothetical protein
MTVRKNMWTLLILWIAINISLWITHFKEHTRPHLSLSCKSRWALLEMLHTAPNNAIVTWPHGVALGYLVTWPHGMSLGYLVMWPHGMSLGYLVMWPDGVSRGYLGFTCVRYTDKVYNIMQVDSCAVGTTHEVRLQNTQCDSRSKVKYHFMIDLLLKQNIIKHWI